MNSELEGILHFTMLGLWAYLAISQGYEWDAFTGFMLMMIYIKLD